MLIAFVYLLLCLLTSCPHILQIFNKKKCNFWKNTKILAAEQKQ